MVEPDAELLAALGPRAKRQIRQRMRSLRSALPPASAAARSEAIVARLMGLPEFAAARGIGLFWPMQSKNEVDLRPLDAAARERGIKVYYPFLAAVGNTVRTGFRRVDDVGSLEPRGSGFAEPGPECPEARRGDIDWIVVPALAVDASGYRIGYGKGFYDATLPDFVPPARAAAVAFGFQLVGEVPREAHDVGCDVVVTDEAVLEIPVLVKEG
jgi:5-formyltetrahydrofolate cyclo-ligase